MPSPPLLAAATPLLDHGFVGSPVGPERIGTPGSVMSIARRPARKSTLTQQQKNQKRQRATQDQLNILENEFIKNPTPTAGVRERIANDINMTERSVQIWFQNRRAKIKVLAKKTIEAGEDCGMIPESMRHYLALKEMESGKPLSEGMKYLGNGANAAMIAYGSGSMMLGQDSIHPGKTIIHHFACRSLSIGTWRRVGQNAMDLVVFYSPEKGCITYYINNDSAGYKIEYPFAYMRSITLQGDPNHPEMELSGPKPAGLVIELLRPPHFFMDSSGSGGFYQCGDFTEDQQASSIMTHHLGGHPKSLQGQLTKLRSLDAFQNRLLGPERLPAPGPPTSTVMSPGIIRPQSAAGLIGGPMAPPPKMLGPPVTTGPRGHKRQRSRSVPIAIDFSARQRPLPLAWHHEAASGMSPLRLDDVPLFAPIPTYHPAAMSSLGPTLQVDVSSGYGIGMQGASLPMMSISDSPPSFAEPSEMSHIGAAQDGLAPGYGPMFGMPCYGPPGDPIRINGPSLTPLSEMSHHDPVIANQSPPMRRNDSLDLFGGPADGHDTHDFNDDSFALTEHFSKQTLEMPLQSPGMDNLPQDFDLQSMLSFPIDSASMSPEQYGGLQVPVSEV